MNKQLTIISLLLLVVCTQAAYKCLAGTNGCSACNTTNDGCTQCKSKWYLDALSKQCKPCSQAGCLVCSDAAKCSSADVKFALYNEAPVPCPAGCLMCTAKTSATDIECKQADIGYYLKPAAAGVTPAYPTVEKCADNCAACEDGTVAKCTRPKQGTKDGSKDGWYFDLGLGRCTLANCAQCKADRTKCTACKNGFFPVGTVITSCSACMANCISCTEATTCTTCALKFRYDVANKKCVACTAASNCLYCTGTSDVCTEPCEKGWSIISGTCQKCADNCLSCSEAGTCKSDGCDTINGYIYKVSDKSCGVGCFATGCASCAINGQGLCDTCKAGYGKTAANICSQCHTSCKKDVTCNINGGGKCDSSSDCELGYSLNSANECAKCESTTVVGCNRCTFGTSPAVTCSANSCKTGYVQLNGLCISCTGATPGYTNTGTDPKALTCIFDGTSLVTVKSCVDGYGLFNGKCYDCKTITFYAGDNAIVDKNANTCTLQEPVVATACVEGYGPDANGICKACSVASCKTCSAEGTCTACITGKFLANATTCTTRDHCTTTTSSVCTQCEKGWYWDATQTSNAGACVAKDHCIESGSDKCTQCELGWFWDGTFNSNAGACTAKDHCKHSTSNKCDQCETGWYWDGTLNSNAGACASSTGCTTSAGNVCSACATGYYKNASNACISSDNCTGTGSNLCNACGDGFIINAASPPVCEACTVLNCKTCNPKATCSACKVGFFLLSNACVAHDGCDGLAHTNNLCSNCAANYAKYRNKCVKITTTRLLAGSTLLSSNYNLATAVSSTIQFGLRSDTCIAGASYVSAVSDQCISCQAPSTNFALSAQTSGTDANCSTCTFTVDGAVTCSTCTGAYAVISNKCEKCADNCTSKACSTKGQCTVGQCVLGFGSDTTTTCTACAAGCDKCTANSDICEVCKTGLKPNADNKGCSDCTANCKSGQCDVGGKCNTNQCQPGYYLTSAGQCKQCYSLNCFSCTSDALSACDPKDEWGKYFSGTVMGTAITNILQCAANCAVCFGKEVSDCLEANAKFYLDNTVSPPAIVPCVTGCDSCSKGVAPNLCETKTTGFYLDNTVTPNVLKACPVGCSSCGVTGTGATAKVTCSGCPTNDLGGSL